MYVGWVVVYDRCRDDWKEGRKEEYCRRERRGGDRPAVLYGRVPGGWRLKHQCIHACNLAGPMKNLEPFLSEPGPGAVDQ